MHQRGIQTEGFHQGREVIWTCLYTKTQLQKILTAQQLEPTVPTKGKMKVICHPTSKNLIETIHWTDQTSPYNERLYEVVQSRTV